MCVCVCGERCECNNGSDERETEQEVTTAFSVKNNWPARRRDDVFACWGEEE